VGRESRGDWHGREELRREVIESILDQAREMGIYFIVISGGEPYVLRETLTREGVMFGISVTQTRHNLGVILDDAFVEHFLQQGAIFGWYFMFMPVGKDPLPDLVPHGHEHSEDLISNPESRWYRYGYRYGRLFRFRKAGRRQKTRRPRPSRAYRQGKVFHPLGAGLPPRTLCTP
jgi:MoaA/NifB/PqqE/SkfB family radical SAM enzyme